MLNEPTPDEIIALVKFPNDKFRISASRVHCVEIAGELQKMGMANDDIIRLITTLYQDAFAEADYQRLGEKFDSQSRPFYRHDSPPRNL